jgi:hypothetical protein
MKKDKIAIIKNILADRHCKNCGAFYWSMLNEEVCSSKNNLLKNIFNKDGMPKDRTCAEWTKI